MAAPLVGAPLNSGSPAEADIVAYGAGSGANTIIYFSADFGTTWPAGTRVTLPAGSGRVFSMVFASATRLYAGTTNGRVFRVDQSGGTWTATRIDNAAGGTHAACGAHYGHRRRSLRRHAQLDLHLVGGTGDFRHVWRFDGTAWQARSGGTVGSGTELLDVEHNAIVYDATTNRLFVGADIGAWETADAGVTWAPMANGLPDAPVFDLQTAPHRTPAASVASRTRRLGMEARRADPARRGALRPRHHARHGARREHRRAKRPVDLPDGARSITT